MILWIWTIKMHMKPWKYIQVITDVKSASVMEGGEAAKCQHAKIVISGPDSRNSDKYAGF